MPTWLQSAHYDFDERVLLDDERMIAELHNQVGQSVPHRRSCGRQAVADVVISLSVLVVGSTQQT